MAKGPGGRPSKYKSEFCQMLIQHMKSGLSYESFAAICNVALSQLYEWEKKHKEFQEAKGIGIGHSRLWWEKTGIDGLWDLNEYQNGKLSHQKKLNSTVWVFNMKNRFAWRDAVEMTQNINIDGIVFDADYEPKND